MDQSIDGKICSCCKQWKLFGEFNVRTRSKDGFSSECRTCKSIRDKKYYQQNKEKFRLYKDTHAEQIRSYMKEWRLEHQNEIQVYNQRWYQEHIEHKAFYWKHWSSENKVYLREYYIRNRSRILAYGAQRYQLQKSRLLELCRRYRAAHRDLYKSIGKQYRQLPRVKLANRVKSHLRRLRLVENGGVHTVQDVLNQGESQNWCCWWCGVYCEDNYHEDHYIPLARGGSNWPKNIVISCPECNFSKGDKTPEEFIEYLNRKN